MFTFKPNSIRSLFQNTSPAERFLKKVRLSKFSLLILTSLSFLLACQPDEEIVFCDVLVIGEGTGAVAAAVQSARSGATTILVNPMPWLGGMLTAAGVSATDGNHQLPAGLWGEYRQYLRDHYGGTDSLFTGWVSNTMFEPRIGAHYWQQIVSQTSGLNIYHRAEWLSVEKNKRWQTVVLLEDGRLLKVKAKVLIDGTDLGDVAAAAGVAYDLGMDARSSSGEIIAPEESNNIVQDLTWVAILKDFGDSTDHTIQRPMGYQADLFACACQDMVSATVGEQEGRDCGTATLHPCLTMLNYGRLPNDKYMLNWPIHGNDYYANVVEMSPEERAVVYKRAKEHTLGFIYYIQKELGYRHLGLADDEFPTPDRLALMPYHREGRRIKGMVRLNVDHIQYPDASNLYRTGIAVGDYPIDHHHDKHSDAPAIDFPQVPSFSIPMACLIPLDVDHLLIADKAISVSNIVNGSSRLQPVIIQVGQVAGLMAAMATKENKSPRELSIRKVQAELLEANGYLLPFIDITPEDPHYKAVQRVGASGILKGRRVPYKWANQTWFDSDSTLLLQSFLEELQLYEPQLVLAPKWKDQPPGQQLSIGAALECLAAYGVSTGKELPTFGKNHRAENFKESQWSSLQLNDFNRRRLITRIELAVLIDYLIDPFNAKMINFNGDFTSHEDHKKQ